MKKTLIYLFITLLAGCETMNDHPAEMRKMINWGKCSEAEAYARRNFREDYLSWMLGNVALECRKNRNLAIQYYTAGARANSEYSHLSANALASLGEKSPVSQQDIALQQCINNARNEERTCALTAYGGVNSISNPIIRERQQVCTDRRMSAEEHCLRMHKPSALQGVPARVPIPQPAQPQQIIIQQQPMTNPNSCIQDGGGIYCPNYRR